MNPEKFEQALQRALASAARPDPTPAWKADILARAAVPPVRKIITFPRLILLAWAACWTLALVLRFMTPATASDQVAQSKTLPSSLDMEWRTLENRRATLLSFLASNDSSNLPHP